MPPVSQAQRRLMHAAANSRAVAKKTGVKQSVAKEFAAADQPGKLPERVKPDKKAKDKVSPRPSRPAAGRPARGRGL